LSAGLGIINGDSKNSSSAGSFNLGFAEGGQGALTLGYRLAPNSDWGTGRVELEVGYRQNQVDQIEFSDGQLSGSGEVVIWDLMFNSYGEYLNGSRWTPYGGLGLGAALFALQQIEVGAAPVLDDQDLVLAYQLAFGLEYSLTSNVEFDLGYRFFGTGTPSLTDAQGARVESEYQVHNLQLGLRVYF
jgi:opacity protein-like surface antigen